jgi:aspartate/methionine/tyrosine aminotransferase
VNNIASELNRSLENTAVFDVLSELGKRIYFPRGIVAQTAEASEKAKKYNASAGMAFSGQRPIILPSLQRYINELAASEIVSYAPTPGCAELRTLWKEWMLKKNPSLSGSQISLPAVTCGLTNGISLSADLFIDKGDEILLPDLFWGNYRLIFEERREAKIVTYPLFTDSGGFNTDGLEHVLETQRERGKAVLLFNFPNNPSGYSPTEQEVRTITEILLRSAESGMRLLVICDDAYFGLYYEPELYRQSLFAAIAALHENIVAVKVDGATKEDFAWGLRVGFLSINTAFLSDKAVRAIEEKIKGIIRSSVSNSSRLGQSLLYRLIRSGSYEEEKEKEFKRLEERYRIIRTLLEKKQNGRELLPLPFNSGYFLTFHCGGINAETLRQRLLEKETGCISIGEHYLRAAFSAVDTEQLEDFFSIIFETADELSV